MTGSGSSSIVDAHIHQWDPLETPRKFSVYAKLLRFLPIPLDLAMRFAPSRDTEFTADATAYTRPYLPANYRDDAGAAPVRAIVHVEAEWAGSGANPQAAETRWVASLPFGVDTPALGAIIGSADPAAPDFAALLDAHAAASPLFRGIRTMVAHHPDSGVRSYTPRPDALTNAAFLDGFATLAERGLSFEAWVYSGQIPQVTALARRYPEASIVLNHLGTPAGAFGPVGKRTGRTPGDRAALLARWREDLTELAEQPNVTAKVSGLMMPILGHPVPPRGQGTPVAELVTRVGPLLTHALDVFGADRLIWGSNFPVDRPITTLEGAVDTVTTALAGAGASVGDLQKVFHDNAVRVYRLDLDG
ncbi:amidohydrolase family protein [Nocardia thailandica]|uniref:amidohydrolase family protein n=1 Tax=Nocardia thailandica TaxID=257275 RepID=UPI0002F59E32|nr:amidohydrolase family protein [Nocardia thailandica]